MVPLVFFFFLMNIPPVHPWDTNQENYNGLFKGFFEENKTIFSLVRKSGERKYKLVGAHLVSAHAPFFIPTGAQQSGGMKKWPSTLDFRGFFCYNIQILRRKRGRLRR